MIEYRRLRAHESDAAAALHRRAGVLIPGYDPSWSTLIEDQSFYRDRVMRDGPVWGAFRQDRLLGHIAMMGGWIDHLYVEPALHGRGIGSALIDLAKRRQDELRLYTYQSNLRARRFYESHGFAIEELTDGARNEERMPDITYRWRRLYAPRRAATFRSAAAAG